jgi:hypothetical protein
MTIPLVLIQLYYSGATRQTHICFIIGLVTEAGKARMTVSHIGSAAESDSWGGVKLCCADAEQG